MRYYNSSTGRFISEDPIGFAGQDSNFFRYVKNNPHSFVDPLGLTQEDINLAFKYVLKKYPDARNLRVRVATVEELGSGYVGRFNPSGNEVLLHPDYLKKLSSKEALILLDTIFHEVGHSQNLLKALGDVIMFWEDGVDDYFHKQIYDQAILDTADAAKDFLLERKRQCPRR